jgi:stage V sporulation protein B
MKSSATRLKTVYTTATLVTGLSVFKRGLGFLYRIVLSRLIGAEGMGLYQIAYSLFAVFLTLGAGGIPVTVSRLISKSKAEHTPKTERSAVGAGALVALVFSLFVLVFVLPIVDKSELLLSDTRAESILNVLSIGLVFSSVYAVLKGSFFGNQRFLLPSLLELLEESVMTITGVLLLRNATSAYDGALKAAWAVVVSDLIVFTVAVISFFVGGGKVSWPQPALRPLLSSALPITSMRVGGSLINSAISVLLPVMLIRAGFSSEEALKLFGVASGMALPMLMLPTTFIGSIATVLMPKMSEDFYAKRKKRLYAHLTRGISVAILISAATTPFLLLLGKEIGALAFSNRLAGEIIRNGCWILPFMSLAMMTTSMLNCMGFEKQSFFFYFIGAAGMLLCILFLPAVFGIYAYIAGFGVNFALICVCNFVFLHQKCDGFFATHGKALLRVTIHALLAFVGVFILGMPLCKLCFRIFSALIACLVVGLFIAAYILVVYAILSVFRKKQA